MRYVVVILLVAFSAAAHAQSLPLVVIGNSTGAPASLRMSELRSLFMGERQRWRDGTKVRVALMKSDTEVGRVISSKVFEMSSDEVKKFITASIFSGKIESPESFDSVEELQRYVKKNPGAIGIIDLASCPADAPIVTVDGKKTF